MRNKDASLRPREKIHEAVSGEIRFEEWDEAAVEAMREIAATSV
jgi:hypothetical protein